jgi:hypothetical protein
LTQVYLSLPCRVACFAVSPLLHFSFLADFTFGDDLGAGSAGFIVVMSLSPALLPMAYAAVAVSSEKTSETSAVDVFFANMF